MISFGSAADLLSDDGRRAAEEEEEPCIARYAVCCCTLLKPMLGEKGPSEQTPSIAIDVIDVGREGWGFADNHSDTLCRRCEGGARRKEAVWCRCVICSAVQLLCCCANEAE